MFLQLYRTNGGILQPNQQYGVEASPYLEAHPVQLAFLMDQTWSLRNRLEFPLPRRQQLPPDLIFAFPFYEAPFIGQDPPYLSVQNVQPWDQNLWFNHLIYAYMIENTRIYEIFEKVIFEYFHGEKLGFPMQPGTVRWLRTAEELFYRSSSNFLMQSFVSNIRSDIRASRRNAYYRLLGMDLNHGTGGASNYPYYKPTAANKEFVALFEELLSEVWIGIAYETSIAGPNPIDDAKMEDLIRRIRELLTTRKQAGNLAREEFYHVATMSWMHLTLFVDDAPVIQDMGISAESPAERLKQMGDRVGYPAHPKADAFFQMAEEISQILVCIEHLDPLDPDVFYAQNGVLRDPSETVITQWSIATGKDIKAMKVRPGTITSSAK